MAPAGSGEMKLLKGRLTACSFLKGSKSIYKPCIPTTTLEAVRVVAERSEGGWEVDG